MQRDFELSVRWVYEAVLKNGDIAVDVGAHIGAHSIPIAQAVSPQGKLYAIEPLPDCRNQLTRKLSSGGGVRSPQAKH